MSQKHSKMSRLQTSKTALACLSILLLTILHFFLSILRREQPPNPYLLHQYYHHHCHSNSRPYCPYVWYYLLNKKLPWWLGSKESTWAMHETTCNAGDADLTPRSGRSPGEGNDYTLQYSCWEIPWTEELGRLLSIESQEWNSLATKTPPLHLLDKLPTSSDSLLLSVLTDCCQTNHHKVQLKPCHSTTPKCLAAFYYPLNKIQTP